MLEVTLTDSQSNTGSTTTPVTVILPPNQTPSTPQIFLPSGVIVGEQITATAGASDPQSLPLFYTFSWGDGSPDTAASDNTATHIYNSSGSFVVTATATNGLGYYNSNTSYLYVAP